MSQPFYAVVPAGGSGTRLWPLSRRRSPKFLHALGGAASLLQSTAARMELLTGPDRIMVVCGASHLDAVREQLPRLPAANLVTEPAPRESAPAIALAAALIHAREPDAVMGSFAADHLIQDPIGFRAVARTAIEVAETGSLVTIGLTPDRPETGYGYIRTGSRLDIGGARRVSQFKEKPDLATAEAYLASGDYLWNAGMFLWRVGSLLAELAAQLPELYDGVQAIAAAYADGDGPRVQAELWPTLPRISIDHGIMEGAAAGGRVSCVPGDFGWTDLGDWDTLGSVLPRDASGCAVLGPGEGLLLDSGNCVVSTWPGRSVVLFGVQDLVAVDTGEVVLVCPRGRAQEVGAVVSALRAAGRDDLL